MGQRGEGGGALRVWCWKGGAGMGAQCGGCVERVGLGWVHSVGAVLGGWGWDGCTVWGLCWEGGAGMGARCGGGVGKVGLGWVQLRCGGGVGARCGGGVRRVGLE